MSQQHYPNRSAYDVIIGIDPDVEKSGVACRQKYTNNTIEVVSYSILPLVRYLGYVKKQPSKTLVIIEASWLKKKKNWHTGDDVPAGVGQSVAYKVGRNHQVGFTIVEFCEELGLDYFLYIPTQKKKTITFLKKQFGIVAKNQEEVDAVMMVL